MPRYRKKPVEIDAVPVHSILARHFGNDIPLEDWAEAALREDDAAPTGMKAMVVVAEDHNGINVQTAEGVMFGHADDWLIRGVAGELYPCKPDIFAATYEDVA